MKTLDIGLLKSAMSYIELHPDEHDQGAWIAPSAGSACGTTMCLAGHIAVQAGAQAPTFDGRGRFLVANWRVDPKTGALSREANAIPAARYASTAAGLSHSQAGALFHEASTIADLRAMINFLELIPTATRDELVQAAGIYAV